MSGRPRRVIGDVSIRSMRGVLLVVAALFVVSWSSTSHAYPWMLKYGYEKCGSCHTDPMGGETLTGFGRVMSDTTLSTRWDGGKDPTNRALLFFGVEEPRELRFGGSIRYMTFLHKFPYANSKASDTTFPMQVDAYGEIRPVERLRISGSIGASKVPAGSPYAVAAQITKNNAGDQWNLLSRSHWIGYDVSSDVLVRAGRMNLPFGMRIPEHVMWVRSATRTDRESAQQHGVAVSYNHGVLRGELMGILGNYQVSPDRYRERGYSLYGEYLLSPHAGVGVSSLITHAADDRLIQNGQGNTRQAHGVTARASPMTPLAILAEGDVLLSSQTTAGYVGMVQGDYEFAQGFHAILTGEILDAGKLGNASSVRGAGQSQLGGWITFGWFFFTHFDMRADVVFRQETPVTFQSQLHYYF